jgi:hypothetical protein
MRGLMNFLRVNSEVYNGLFLSLKGCNDYRKNHMNKAKTPEGWH